MSRPDAEASAASPNADADAELEARWRFVELSRAVLDGVSDEARPTARARVDLAVLPFFEDERPLQGVAGLIDWRGCGRLSSYLRRELGSGQRDEQLLTVGGPDQPADRIFMLGLGRREAFDEQAAIDAGERCVRTVVGLGARSVMLGMPDDVERGVIERWLRSVVEHDAATRRAAGAASESSVEDAERRAAPRDGEGTVDEADGAVSTKGASASDADASAETDPTARGAAPDDPSADPDAAGESGPAGDGVVGTQASGDPAEDSPAADAESGPDDAEPADPPAGSADPGARPTDSAGRAASASGPDDPERQARDDQGSGEAVRASDDPQLPLGPPRAVDTWWVVAEARAVGRLRRALSGPPRAASGA